MKNSKSIIIILVVILLVIFIGVGVVGYSRSKNSGGNGGSYDKLDDNLKTEVFNVNDLLERLNYVGFDNQVYSAVSEDNYIDIEAMINEGIVSVKIKVSDAENSYERSYNLDSITDVVSIGTAYEKEGKVLTYFMTKSGKVYKVEDVLSNVESNKNYVGQAKDLGVKRATGIHVATSGFALNDNVLSEHPAVYIKTSDNRIYTDESFKNDGSVQEGLVEVKEK